jgi:exonuclease SbcC
MKPEKLTLENFGPFSGKISIDFTKLDDIFLITGKTGAGKTTIFDAICFVLYGEVPGGRNDHLSRLKSDFGDQGALVQIAGIDGGECAVSLEFSLGKDRYRIERSPKQEKPKKRGSGTTVVEETAVLCKWVNGGWESTISRKSEVDKEIKQLIGLDAKEFFKIVLLPQGEFAQFLKQSTSERKDVLGKLFPVETASKIKEMVAERAKEAASQVKEAQNSLLELSKRISLDDFDEIQAQFAEKLKYIKTKIAALTGEEADLNKKIGLKRQEEALFGRLSSIKAEFEQNEAEAPAIREKEAALSLSRKAQPLRQDLAFEEQTRESLTQREREADAARTACRAASLEQENAEKGASEIAKIESKIKLLREKRPMLIEAREEEAQLSVKRQQARQAEAQHGQLADQRVDLARKFAEKDAEIQGFEAISLKADGLDAQFETARAVKDDLVALKKAAEEAEPLVIEADALKTAIESLEKRHAELDKRVPVLADEVKNLEAEQKAHENADMAAGLSATLKKGEPCPVCGSLDHPRPAAAVERIFGITERLESLRNSLESAKKEAAVCKTELEAKTQELGRLRRQLDAKAKEAGAIAVRVPLLAGQAAAGAAAFPPSVPDASRASVASASETAIPGEAAIAALLKRQVDSLTAISNQRTEAKRASLRLPVLYKEKTDLQTLVSDIETQLALNAEKQKSLALEIKAIEEKHRRIIGTGMAGMDGAITGTAGIDRATGAPVSAEQALTEADAALADAEARLDRLQKTLEQARNGLAGARAREGAAQAAAEEAARKYEEARLSLKSGLAASPFADAGSLRAAILLPDAEAAFESAIGNWKDDRSRIASLQSEVESNLASLRAETTGDGDAAAIQTRLDQVKEEQAAAETERDAVQIDIAEVERDNARIKEKQQQFAELTQKSESLARLKDDIEGRNPKKRAFDAWLLGKYLAVVAAFATKRLERMSEGRYSLLLDSERETGRGLSGLDLQVFDAYTGKTRPVATLSGGESFMASISLALGLADSIQARSGGIRLDAVFIDEGFGTLDEASLDKAMGILDELRDHRMVGLISHRGDLMTRIPSRVEVIKGAAGSRIQIASGTDGA